MTKEELAALLNGRQIGDEITEAEELEAEKNRLVVIFGASDDLCELRGFIHDELDSYREAMVFISKDGELLPEIHDDDIEVLTKYGALGYVQSIHEKATKISAHWCAGKDCCWTYETKAPHAVFSVMEGDEVYCKGIVLEVSA